MPIKYQNKYKIESARLKNWDYSREGYYFITICAKNRQGYFGRINNYQIELSKIGIMANKYWQAIPDHFSNVLLDEFIIMPNHIHGIVVIKNRPNKINQSLNVDGKYGQRNKFGPKNKQMSKISPKPNSLSVIIRSYKSICTREINSLPNKIFFAWQPRFYDRIIRNESELNRIRKYIRENPKEWKEDGNYIDIP